MKAKALIWTAGTDTYANKVVTLLTTKGILIEVKFMYHVYQFVIKDTDEQPDKEVHRVRSRGIPSAGAYFPGTGMCSLTQKFQ